MNEPSTGFAGSHSILRDLLAALQWIAIIVPPSLGMWVFGAALVGIGPSAMGSVLAGAFLAVGAATLLQLGLGWRAPVFEGPASVHLATVVVIAGSRGGTAPLEEVMGGLIVAGLVVLLLGMTGADRALAAIFTPAATAAFVLALIIVLIPDALSQAIHRSTDRPFGTGDAWFVLAAALTAGAFAYLQPALRPFALLLALVGGVGARLAVGWPPAVALDAGWTLPLPFAAGWPRFTMAASLPFALAGIAGGFNVVGSLSAMAATTSSEEARPRRGLVVNGLVQGLQSAFVGFVGSTGHLESASVVRMLGRGGRRSLTMAAATLVILAFVDPVVRALATIPPQVSGTLLLVLMLVLSILGIEITRSLHPLSRWLVVGPALIPALWWSVADPSGDGAAALMNPIALAVGVALVAERLLGVRAVSLAPADGSVDDSLEGESKPPDSEASIGTEERVV